MLEADFKITIPPKNNNKKPTSQDRTFRRFFKAIYSDGFIQTLLSRQKMTNELFVGNTGNYDNF